AHCKVDQAVNDWEDRCVEPARSTNPATTSISGRLVQQASTMTSVVRIHHGDLHSILHRPTRLQCCEKRPTTKATSADSPKKTSIHGSFMPRVSSSRPTASRISPSTM